MTTIAISEFRANMSSFLQKVQSGEIISLTQRGTEIARIVPPNISYIAAVQLRDELRKTAVVGDLLAPLDVEWEANTD